MSDLNSRNKDYIEIILRGVIYKVSLDQLAIPIILYETNGNEILIRGQKGIKPIRGLRAKANIVEESSGYEDNVKGILANLLDRQEKHKEKIEQQDKQSKMDKLEELCRPISDYLKENYCPYDSVVITDDKIRLVRDEIGIPVDRNSEEEDALDNIYDKLVKEITDEVYSALGLNITSILRQNRI